MSGECPAELDVANFSPTILRNGRVEVGEGPGIAELEGIVCIQDLNGFTVSGKYILASFKHSGGRVNDISL